jgi:hypothetical protein
MSDLLQSVNATRETIEAPVNGKPTRPDPDAYRTELLARLADGEKELARDQKALEAARAKVAELEGHVEFDGWRVGSRTKEIAEFDRLRAKAAK